MNKICAGLFCFLWLGAAARAAEPVAAKSGLDLQSIDKAADPCKDFYQYACGNWIKQNPIPADESSWGRFNELHDRNQATLKAIAEDSAAHQNRSALDQKIGAFYQSCMDEAGIEKKGASPLQSELERIAHIGNKQELLDEIVRLHQRQVDLFFTLSSNPDPNNAKMMIGNLDQGGLGLPEKDYYFRTDTRTQAIRQKYLAHITKMFELIGVPDLVAASRATTVMAIETDLAKASLDVTSRRDPKLLVHDYTVDRLSELTPDFDFKKYFTAVQTPAFSNLNVSVPEFLKGFDDLLNKTSVDDLKAYVTWRYVDASASLLSKPFVMENFDFYSRTLTGASQLKPRWKRCVSMIDGELGEALGRKFVEKTFGEEGKQRTLELVGQIEHEMATDIQTISWMSPETQQQAMLKLHAVANKIGYPDKWRDYSTVNIAPDDYLGNFYRANEFESKRERDRIGKPADKTEWEMTPPTVNAYYDPTQNNINFPAGILQSPFYSNKADDAVNFGGIGAVIGHELTHGFDDEGRQFDAEGNLKDWWQKQDEEKFEKLADCIVQEYGNFSPAPDLKLNGKLTLGENTADNGGLRLSYMALTNQLDKQGISPTHKLDGYTETQQFFLSFGQVWCENEREESARLHAQTDPHSPPAFRVNGTVRNMPEFSQAFGCKANDKMYAAKACRVW